MNYEEQYDFVENYLADKQQQQVDYNKCYEEEECEHVIIYDNTQQICTICGLILKDYDLVNEFAIFDRCTIKQQSIYKRKAYLQVILKKYDIQRLLWDKVIFLFCKMERIFEKEDMGRNNMISYNVVIRGILWKQHRYQEAKKVPLLKTKKTRIIHQKIFYKLWDMIDIE